MKSVIACYAVVLLSWTGVSAESPLIYPPSDVLSYARSLGARLTEIRRDFHRHPELAFEEVRTTAKIKEILATLPSAAAMFAACALRKAYPEIGLKREKEERK